SLSHIHLLFFFTATTTTDIYTLSLHDALPILRSTIYDLRFTICDLRFTARSYHACEIQQQRRMSVIQHRCAGDPAGQADRPIHRSEEHTSELQSRENLVCRLLLEKKKKEREKR